MTIEWRPDTCACILQYDEIHGESGVPIWTFFQSCGVHPNATSAFNDNRMKNQQQNAIAKALGKNPEELSSSFRLIGEGVFEWNYEYLSEDDKAKAEEAVRLANG